MCQYENKDFKCTFNMMWMITHIHNIFMDNNPKFMPAFRPMCKRIVAMDISRLIEGSLYYVHVKTIIVNFFQLGDIIIFWDSDADVVTPDLARKWFSKKEGRNCMEPSKIIEALVSNRHTATNTYLIPISDGEVETKEIDTTDAIISKTGIMFSHVTTFLINKGSHGNMSVAYQFTRY